MYEYLTHKNNPDKYHYPIDSIIQSDKWEQELFEQACSYTTDPNEKMVELLSIVRQYHITEYSEAVDKLLELGRLDLLGEVKKSWVQRYMTSHMFHERQRAEEEHEKVKEEYKEQLHQFIDEDRKR
jgi:hypothetical protein